MGKKLALSEASTNLHTVSTIERRENKNWKAPQKIWMQISEHAQLKAQISKFVNSY